MYQLCYLYKEKPATFVTELMFTILLKVLMTFRKSPITCIVNGFFRRYPKENGSMVSQ